MSVKSMTGFGRGEAVEGAVKVVVELSTVNRKQFDCSISLPRELVSLDAKIQALVHAHVTRGYVKGLVTVTASEQAGTASALDLDRLTTQLDAVRTAAQALGLADDLTASSLLRFPDLLRPSVLPDDPLDVWPLMEKAVQAALEKLDAMRLREGGALEQDLRARFAALEALSHQIAELAPTVPVTYQAVLERRLSELLGTGQMADPALISREVAVFADRCDVSEELTRLASHFAQVTKVFDAGGACGRTLDFLCQELFREINTTGSKANDAAISRLVIDFKAGLEAVREQVQNIE
ncbi:MAG TPA: YicC family protein [Kiritimatiellia bacterium]|nr:YicC family protein [Kiritimatiellia bacterium]